MRVGKRGQRLPAHWKETPAGHDAQRGGDQRLGSSLSNSDMTAQAPGQSHCFLPEGFPGAQLTWYENAMPHSSAASLGTGAALPAYTPYQSRGLCPTGKPLGGVTLLSSLYVREGIRVVKDQRQYVK